MRQYLSTSPRSHHDILSGGGALKRGKRVGSLLDDPDQEELRACAAEFQPQKSCSTPVCS